MKIPSGTFCPFVQGECVQFKCVMWTQLRGKHPQTGEPVDDWDCAVKWLPILLIEGAQETRQAAAAIESFRNEMVRANQLALSLADNDGTAVRKINNARDDHQR